MKSKSLKTAAHKSQQLVFAEVVGGLAGRPGPLSVGVGVLPALLAWPWGTLFRLRRWPACLRSTQAAGRANPSRGQCCSGPWLHGALQAGWVLASTLGCQHPRGRTHPPPPEHGSFRTLAPAPSACRLCCAFCSPELPEASGPCPSSNPRGLQEACGVQSSLRDVWPW